VYQMGVVIIKGEGVVFWVNLGHPIVTSGDFVAYLCGSAYSNRAVIGVVSGVGPGIDVLDGGSRA